MPKMVFKSQDLAPGLTILMSFGPYLGMASKTGHMGPSQIEFTASLHAERRTCNPLKGRCACILFTIRDNDTFPLWYAPRNWRIQDRCTVYKTSLFATDWYIDPNEEEGDMKGPTLPSQLTTWVTVGLKGMRYYFNELTEQVDGTLRNVKMNWVGQW